MIYKIFVSLVIEEDDDEEELAEALEEIIEYVRTIAMLFYTHFNDDAQEIKPILTLKGAKHGSRIYGGITARGFTERRQKVLAQMQPNSALLLFSEIEKRRNNDCDFPFRQDSYFWYLTGFNEPNAALLLIKTEDAEKAVVFLRPRDPLLEPGMVAD